MVSPQKACSRAVVITVGVALMPVYPIIGVLAVPINAIKALVHGIFLNYHWRHSKNEQGLGLINDRNAFGKPQYMSKNAKFEAKDLTRLEHEEKRITAEEKLFSTLKVVRAVAKLIIPIIGIFWVVLTEINTGGSAAIGCGGDCEHENHWKNKDAIRWHIENLKKQLPERNIVNVAAA